MRFEQYERGLWAEYAAFGEVVAAILRAAIERAPDYRLQQVRCRAKDPASLRKKLENRSKGAGDDLLVCEGLEDRIKDLAGCRVIFYTNLDVDHFIDSGLIASNFEILEAKTHHPRRDIDDATLLYVSNHYLVTLRGDRLTLPEYARFSGLRCEVQIQTILNHAWAEMAHDTIYKEPDLGTFGSRALGSIKERMGRIARRYLVPAGYEFAKVAADFDRLVEGGELFRGQALEAVVDASDNNERADALDTLMESVIPLYDDLSAEYPDILDAMLRAAARARETADRPITTRFGELPAKSSADVLKRIAQIIGKLRYVDPEASFETLVRLYADARGDAERLPLLEITKRLAAHNLDVWRQYGPEAQIVLVEHIAAVGDATAQAALPLLAAALGAVLGTEITGTTDTSTTVSYHSAAVVVSDRLGRVRRGAADQLKRLYALADGDDQRERVLSGLQAGTRSPGTSGYGSGLLILIMEAAADLIEFLVEIAPSMSWELLQREERDVLWRARFNRDLPERFVAEPGVAAVRGRIDAAIAAFRGVVQADAEYATYKILVGYQTVYPAAWESGYRYAEEQAFRLDAVEGLVESIRHPTAALWYKRVLRCAKTPPGDLATFPIFRRFLERAGERRPATVLGWLERLDPSLVGFLPSVLLGLQRSARSKKADALMRRWIRDGLHLGPIAWYARSSDPFDETLLVELVGQAIRSGDNDAVRAAMDVAGSRFPERPGSLIGRVFLPALSYMRAADDLSWVGRGMSSWFHPEIIAALDEAQAGEVLAALIPHPDVDHGATVVIGAVARRWPASVLRFFGDRIAMTYSEARPKSYHAVPLSIGDEVREPLARSPDVVLAEARTWYDQEASLFRHLGGRFVASIFPELRGSLSDRLHVLFSGTRGDVSFALAILAAFQGGSEVESLVRTAVARLDPDDTLTVVAEDALEQGGVYTGEFGLVDGYEERLSRMRGWLDDENERVRTFARRQVRRLEQAAASATRRAEASIAARRLDHGEDLV